MMKAYFLVLFLTFGLLHTYSQRGAEPIQVEINEENIVVQDFQGWGVSLAWWAKIAGEHLTDEELLVVADKLINEAKYNYFRYDIGGGDHPSHSHMREGGDIEGYPQNGNDRQQIRMMRAIAELSQNHDRSVHFEAISYSPPYQMTKSGCTAGNAMGTDNLRDDQYEAFSYYLAEAVDYLNSEILSEYTQNGKPMSIEKLAPFNEPQSNWWKANGNQEGCPFSLSNQVKLLPLVRYALDSLGQSQVKIVVNEANSLEEAVEAAAHYQSGGVLDLIDEYAVHTYFGWPYRKALREIALVQQKEIVVSETGPLNIKKDKEEVFAIMASRIIKDINYLACTIWFDWQAYSTSDLWGLYRQDALKNHLKNHEVSRQLYYRQQFTHFLKPDFKIVENSHMDEVLAAYHENEWAIVVVNETEGNKVYSIDLNMQIDKRVDIEARITSPQNSFEAFKDFNSSNSDLSFTLPQGNVVSFKIKLL